MKKILLLLMVGFLLTTGCTNSETSMETGKDFPVYGGNKAGNRYSPLDQINTGNVKNLQVEWIYNAAEPVDSNNSKSQRAREIQCQPIVVNGILYGTTPELKLFALKAGTGEQLWKFGPKEQRLNVSRGVTYWKKGNDTRILYAVGPSLYAINAKDGKVVTSFGDKGKVDLHEGLSIGLDRDVQTLSVAATSPGVVYKNTFIVGSTVSESGDAAPGHVRAFDVVTGKLKWVFHTIPRPGELGYDTWPQDAYKKIGGANNWSGLTVDEKRGTVYFGTGSPSSDFYGGDRKGSNLFANCVISL
ncbi:MAG: PQQ-binding-like beta-propeller repeat protein, partial [Saprospiraceae bacterium]